MTQKCASAVACNNIRCGVLAIVDELFVYIILPDLCGLRVDYVNDYTFCRACNHGQRILPFHRKCPVTAHTIPPVDAGRKVYDIVRRGWEACTRE